MIVAMHKLAVVMFAVLAGSSLGCAHSSDVFVAPPSGVCGGVTPSRLRVVTWNIRAALSSSLDQIAQDLFALAPDVVMLQEVDRHTSRSGDVDQAAVLADKLGMDSTFAAARAEGRGDFGVALLSRIAFETARRVELPSDNAFEPRVAIDAHLCAGTTHLRAASVHADVFPWAARQNADFLAESLKESVGEGVVVGGDLNASPQSDGPLAFTTRGFIDASADTPTFADRRIDYVFVDEAAGEIGTRIVPDTGEASDHRPQLVELVP
jgi:endonuclease/exonuclease/phosphatase family metal-dependent hydrolase